MKDLIIGILVLIILLVVAYFFVNKFLKDKTSKREKPSGPYVPPRGNTKPQDNKK